MRDDNCLMIPLSRKLTENEATMLRQQLKTVNMTICDFVERQRRVKSLSEVLVDQLPPHLLMKIPRSMDIVGHIAVVEVPPELERYKKILGNAILSVNKSVRTILVKASAVGGKSRLRRFERLAGAHETETVYKKPVEAFIILRTRFSAVFGETIKMDDTPSFREILMYTSDSSIDILGKMKPSIPESLASVIKSSNPVRYKILV